MKSLIASEKHSTLKSSGEVSDMASSQKPAELLMEQQEEKKVDEYFVTLFKKNKKFKLNKIQNAMYEDKNVREHMAQLQDGEDAIAFFAKYGNTTPIKFIHCVRSRSRIFNPYKLSIVHNANDLAKTEEYFTVSPSGIVLIHSSSAINRKEKFLNRTPTEFISLSDWMRESTLFNILSNIDFFKNYLAAKALRTWRENVKKTLFQKTREKIRTNVFFCKPQFVSSLFEIKSDLTKVLGFELVNFSQYSQKQVDFEEFKSTQKDVRIKVAKEFDIIFEKIFSSLNRLISAVGNTRSENCGPEEELSSLARHKPLNLLKKEKQEKIKRRELAEFDFSKLNSFLQLINYMAVETLVEVNQLSFLKVGEELERERKNGLFTTSPTIEDNNINFVHREDDIITAINFIFQENIKLVNDVPRILGHANFESFTKELFGEFGDLSSISPDLELIIRNSASYRTTNTRIATKIALDFAECRKKIDVNYSQCKRIEQEKSKFNADAWISSEPRLEEVKAKLVIMRDFKKESGDKIKDYFFGILHVDSKIMRNILTTFISDSLNKIRDYLYRLMMEKVAETNKVLEVKVNQLSTPFESLPEYCDYIRGVREVKDSLEVIDSNKTTIDQMHKLLKQVNLGFTIEDKSNLEQVVKLREKITEELPGAEDAIKVRREDYGGKLSEQADYVNDKAEELFVLLQCEELRKSSTPSIEASKRLAICKERFEKLESRTKRIKEHAGLMETNLENLKAETSLLGDIYDRKKETWDTFDSFFKKYEEWFEGNIKRLSVEGIEKDVRTFELFCRDARIKTKEQSERSTQSFPQLITQPGRTASTGLVIIDNEENNEILSLIAAKVENMKELMPLLSALCNKHLKDKHWIQVLELIEGGTSLLGKQFLNFQELIGLNVKAHFEGVEEISARATGENSIEQDLEKIRREWQDTTLTLVPYREFKDKFVLSGVSDLFEKLDDHLLKIQAMLGSKFAAEIKDSLQTWEKKLSMLHETLEEWLMFQQQWMYLENVFSAEDIQRQLPSEYARFHAMDRFWRETMSRVQKKPTILDNIGPELLSRFIDSNRQMEAIQRMLEDYLELKRKLFPRFYFLSNDEVLEIFSQTRNPEAIQPHLRKCFDNIKRIRFEESEGEKEKIISMISAEPEADPEEVIFEEPIIARGPVESWLQNIEKAMQKTLHQKLSECVGLMEPQTILIDFDTIFNFPAQIILALNMIRWTSFSEFHIGENSLDVFYSLIQDQVLKSVALIKSELTVGQRELIKNMIISDVHNRDVVEFLKKTEASLTDFSWNKQLKYYWTTPPTIEEDDKNEISVQESKKSLSNNEQKSESEKTCFIGQTNSCIPYGFEYLGNSARLVITPLTDKCYLTLTSALHLTYGGAPAGPAGTGKTETTKDLAKVVAIVCIVFNCSDSLEYRTMGRFFSGLAQCGAWVCFDEFNRIDVEVLSVIAQQIMVIQNAMRERKQEFDFEGKIIPLSLRFGVFITMNPGYAGRSELPDNLKALFRPVAMMIPDYALIAEIMLFSEGFQNAKEFGKKLVQLFKLSSEQLSKQKHYDFGMRAVKAVLNMAGIMRRKEPDAAENDILLKSMRDSNLPKFLIDDIPLFEGIIRDLFPSVKIESAEYPDLQEYCQEFMHNFNYKINNNQFSKIKQIFEVSNIRHGIMLVGNASSGKTTSMDALVFGLKRLGTIVDIYKLNPKAITINELFGFNDIYTNTFTHGIVSKIIAQAMEDTSNSQKWIVFDGPVDAEWIENLNTVLDDNKMLCLPDGKRIKIPNNFTMMFEVENLNAASPATVSRCGMVYFDKFTVDPIDSFYKFKKDLNQKLSNRFEIEPRLKFFFDLFSDCSFEKTLNELLTEAFEAFRQYSDQMIRNTEYSILKSGFRLFEAEIEKLMEIFLKKTRDTKTPQALEKQVKTMELKEIIIALFGFSLIWSLGANLTESAKQEFSNIFRIYLMKRTNSLLVGFNSVFDFHFNPEKFNMSNWKSLVQEFVYSPSIPFNDLLVETSETTTIKYFLNILAPRNIPMLINGGTGVGKTATIKSFLSTLTENYVSASASFSAQTLAKNLEMALMDKLAIRGKDLAPNAGKTLLFFIDDINMPRLDTYGSQSVNEMIRQILDQGGFYDLKKYVFRPVKNTVFLAACAPPEGGRNPMTQRLVRHFHTFSISDVSDESYELIFSSILHKFFSYQKDRENLINSVPLIIKNSIKIYKMILGNLLPSPAKCHYLFNMRDLSKVFQGILQGDPGDIDCEEKLVSLWAHEVLRVFSDRLIDNLDKTWFAEKMLSVCQLNGKFTVEKLDLLNFTSIVSGKYKQTVRQEELSVSIQEALKDYTLINGKDLGLVIFPDMLAHVCRIKRILSFSRGNALLLGISGCGKRALANLAIFLNKNHLAQVEITRNYKFQTWRDDLKAMMKLASQDANLEGKKGVTFLLAEDQLTVDSFLEDVNNLLNIGEIPNIFGREEIEEISNFVASQLKDKKSSSTLTKSDLWEIFLNSVKENFHLVLTFSPLGSNFRSKVRQFPSLVNCCTIDYFSKWPQEALLLVAESEIKKSQLNIESDLLQKISHAAAGFNEIAEKLSLNFYTQTRRKCYITPASFIGMIKSYIKLLGDSQQALPQKIKKYETGLQKLADTKVEIEGLQDKILAFQPQLEQARAENKILLQDLEEKNIVAKEKESICEKEAADISQTQNEVSSMRTTCQAELNEALPALHAAQNAARNIDKSYIASIKSYNVVAKDIEMVLLAINLLFGKKETWEEVKKVLADMELIKKLQNLDPMTVPLKTWTRLRQNYLSKPEFNPVMLKEKISEAISTLANYCINMEIYFFKKREVEPKEQKLLAAEGQLSEVEEAMRVKTTELEEVKAIVDGLRNKLNGSLEKERSLEAEQQRAQLHLERAEKLLVGLSDESKRWQEFSISLKEDEKTLTGDTLLSAATVSLLGPFNQNFRVDLLSNCYSLVTQHDIPISKEFFIQSALGDPVTVRDWQLKGLPADEFSVDNAIIVMNSIKFPLMIDPQMQMNKWLKNQFRDLGIVITKNNNPQLLKIIENSVRFGNTVLLENVEETLESALEPVLLRQTIKKGPMLYLKFNDQEIPFNSDFRLFLTTKLSNPHFLPETTIKVNIINCTVTQTGLESQLLVEIVLNECPKLEEQRDSLIRQISEDKKQLLEIQARILRLINEVQGNLLDDEELINSLDASRATSDAIGIRMRDAEVTNENINKAREVYQQLAVRGAILYFVVSSLNNINFMYQFSLESFISFFTEKMAADQDSKDNVECRVNLLKSRLTLLIFHEIARGLFGCHKLFFAFMIAVRINLKTKPSQEIIWEFFKNPGDLTLKNDDKNIPHIFKERNWSELCSLSVHSMAANLFKMNWNKFESEISHLLIMDDVGKSEFEFFQESLSASVFEAFLLLKIFREDKLEQIASLFVEKVIGRDFLDIPSLNLKKIVLNASQDKPVIFILSPGADPLSSLLTLAQELEMDSRFKIASLGQGQGDRANELIKTSRLNGEWVLLQNCHLATSWLGQLEFLIENPSDEPHSDYRLFLTTLPAKQFPCSILQRGIKLTNEPPKGIRANLRQTYSQMDMEAYNNTHLPIYKTLLFSLSMFHAIALERRKFGAIGWNIPYEWMNSDLETSQKHLLMYLENTETVPFETLTTLIGRINYGGRITDYNDEKIVVSLLLKFFNSKVLNIGHSFCEIEGFNYQIPKTEELQTIFTFIDQLPMLDKPEIFGLNSNASLNQDLQNSKEFKNYLESFEPSGSSTGSEKDSDDIVLRTAERMVDRLGTIIKIDSANNTMSMIIFRNQEAERFNTLLIKIKSSLGLLQDAIKGMIAMSLELENMFNCLNKQMIPENWNKLSYLSLKPLNSWFEDFLKRIEFFRNWMMLGSMKSYWISAFFFPQGFMTAVLQTFSREKQIAIDTLSFKANPTNKLFEKNDLVQNIPVEGVNIHGLILENAHFDIEKSIITEALPKKLLELMPIIWLQPVVDEGITGNDLLFDCPVYKTSERRGELSTTGHSTNFITYFRLCFEEENTDFWVRRGVALLLQTND